MTFTALVARDNDGYKTAFEELTDDDLPQSGEVLVDVAYSSLNYKDALAVTGRGKIVRSFPMVLGIDLAGTVVESSTINSSRAIASSATARESASQTGAGTPSASV